MKTYMKKDLKALAKGACFLGSGGGGTLESANNLLETFRIRKENVVNEKETYYPTNQVQVITKDEALKDGYGVVVAYIGAPAPINEAKFPLGPVAAAQQAKAYLESQGKTLRYVIPVETGALGFIVPCLVAAKLDLQVIDMDGAGRAVPSLPLITYAVTEGVSASPAFLVNQDENLSYTVDLANPSNKAPQASEVQMFAGALDNLMRPIISEPAFGQYGGLALWIMSPSEIQRVKAIHGTMSNALALGIELDTGKKLAEILMNFSPLANSSKILAESVNITSTTLSTTGGFDLGTIEFESTQTPDLKFTIQYVNESLIVWSNKQSAPLCTAPDSIAIVETDSHGNVVNVVSNGDLLTILKDESELPTAPNESEKTTPKIFSIVAIQSALPQTDYPLIYSKFASLLATIGFRGQHPAIDYSKVY